MPISASKGVVVFLLLRLLLCHNVTEFGIYLELERRTLLLFSRSDYLLPIIFGLLQVKYYRDTYAEHPDDRENIEYTVPLENNEALVTLSGMYDQVKNETGANLEYSR